MSDLSTKLENLFIENTTIDDKNQVIIKDGEKIWEDNLPISKEDVEKLSSYRNTFSAAYTKAVGGKVIEHMKSDDKIGHLSCELITPDVDFGFDFARPTAVGSAKLSKGDVRASIGARVTVKGLDSTEEVTDALADMWDFE